MWLFTKYGFFSVVCAGQEGEGEIAVTLGSLKTTIPRFT